LAVCASEAGALDVPEGPVRRGKLGPGQMIAVDPERGFEENAAIKERLARRRSYGAWLEDGLVRASVGEPIEPTDTDLTARQALVGYTREELNVLLRPIASDAHEPASSVGAGP